MWAVWSTRMLFQPAVDRNGLGWAHAQHTEEWRTDAYCEWTKAVAGDSPLLCTDLLSSGNSSLQHAKGSNQRCNREQTLSSPQLCLGNSFLQNRLKDLTHTHCVPQNEALIPWTLLLLSWKTQPNWNQFQNEPPSNEGRELYHVLLHCLDIQIGKNMMASQRFFDFF